MSIFKNLPMLVEEYKYKIEKGEEKPMVFIVTGGGMEVFKLPQTPGASAVLTAMFVPYCWEQSFEFISRYVCSNSADSFKMRATSQDSAEHLCKAGMVRWPNNKIIAITAATTTTRYRRGKNHAYISVGETVENIKSFYLDLPKMSEGCHDKTNIEQYRLNEDRSIAELALQIAFNKFIKL